jgi:adenine-specific DNA-methyltransferase
MPDLRDIRTWRKELGLLPVPLFANPAKRDAHVLLNGASGNFCLYLNSHQQLREERNEAWSANVGHSVLIREESVYVHRWDDRAPFAPRSFSLADIAGGLNEFHRSLENDAPPIESSIVAHAMGVFRSLRGALGRNGHDALQGFLFLLAATIDGVDRSEVDLDHRWHLTEHAREVALTVDGDTWQAFSDELRNRRGLDLKADLALTLRHASGLLFQEAHYATLIDNQLSFPGMLPRQAKTEPDTTAIGLHFTPPALARTIVEEALALITNGPDSMTIFDPACGSGEFLREALRQLALSGFSGRISLVGFDLSRAACAMANFVLAREALDLPGRATFEIRCCDALDPAIQWPADVDVLLMNPPFLSWPSMTSSLRNRVLTVLGDLSYKRPDLSMAFLWKGMASLAGAGVIGTIMPAPFHHAGTVLGRRIVRPLARQTCRAPAHKDRRPPWQS